MNIHSYNDLQQISLGLQQKHNSFKVFCCCVALEKFLEHERQLDLLQSRVGLLKK